MLAAVAAGGALGAPLRWEIGRLAHVAPGSFPWPTFFINVSGSFLLGLLVGVLAAWFPASRYARPFLGIGVLGAYTTMSTFAVETDLLVKDGHVAMAVAYLAASLVVGVAACLGGVVLGRSR